MEKIIIGKNEYELNKQEHTLYAQMIDMGVSAKKAISLIKKTVKKAIIDDGEKQSEKIRKLKVKTFDYLFNGLEKMGLTQEEVMGHIQNVFHESLLQSILVFAEAEAESEAEAEAEAEAESEAEAEAESEAEAEAE